MFSVNQLNLGINENRYRAIEMVSRDGLCLKDEPSWCQDREIVQAAVRQNPLALRYAPLFQNDRRIALIAVRANGLARMWLGSQLQKDKFVQGIAKSNLPQQRLGSFAGARIFSATVDRCLPMQHLYSIKTHIYSAPVFIRLEREESSRFIRDSHVTLFSQTQLLPYPIKTQSVLAYINVMLPPTANHFLIDSGKDVVKKCCAIGAGFKKCNVDQAMVTAYDLNIPFKRGQTCIEGGNCYLFISNGEKKAVVGEVSIYLSMIALKEQGVFKSMAINRAIEPSEAAYRIARNLVIFAETSKAKKASMRESSLQAEAEPTQANEELWLTYRKKLTAPISEEERIKYADEAKIIEAQLNLTKIYIAKELEVLLHNLAFVPQTQFHIDMEMFVTPNGTVVLHDDQKALELLDEIQSTHKLDQEEEGLWIAYRDTALNGMREFTAIREARMEIFRKMHIDFLVLPAVLASPQSALNYCNGILVHKGKRIVEKMPDGTQRSMMKRRRGFAFITTGPTFKAEVIFHKSFVAVFNRAFPKLTLHGVPHMSSFVAKYHGGVHCLTFESALVSEPEVR